MLNNKSSIKAFSLIELMVVIAIVAILASIAIPSYRTYINKTKVVTALTSYGYPFAQKGRLMSQENAILSYPLKFAGYTFARDEVAAVPENGTGVIAAGFSFDNNVSGENWFYSRHRIRLDYMGLPNQDPNDSRAGSEIELFVHNRHGIIKIVCGINSLSAGVDASVRPATCQCNSMWDINDVTNNC